MRIRPVEVAFTFRFPIYEGQDHQCVVVRVALHDGKVDPTISLSGKGMDLVPAELLRPIKKAVHLARRKVRAKDLVDFESEERREDSDE